MSWRKRRGVGASLGDAQKYTAPFDEAADLIASCDDEEPLEPPLPEKLTRTPDCSEDVRPTKADMLIVRMRWVSVVCAGRLLRRRAGLGS